MVEVSVQMKTSRKHKDIASPVGLKLCHMAGVVLQALDVDVGDTQQSILGRLSD